MKPFAGASRLQASQLPGSSAASSPSALSHCFILALFYLFTLMLFKWGDLSLIWKSLARSLTPLSAHPALCLSSWPDLTYYTEILSSKIIPWLWEDVHMKTQLYLCLLSKQQGLGGLLAFSVMAWYRSVRSGAKGGSNWTSASHLSRFSHSHFLLVNRWWWEEPYNHPIICQNETWRERAIW